MIDSHMEHHCMDLSSKKWSILTWGQHCRDLSRKK